jgi:chemotaxis protein methyltransferase CheR
MKAHDIQDIEVDLLVEALYRRHGYDFRHYARASLKRRVAGLASAFGCVHISELIPRLLHDPELGRRILPKLSVPVTDMFRDPAVFLALRRQVLPVLASYPRINIWQAGCASGEEVYSLAIVLREEGLTERAHIYATDINDDALARAEEGVFPLRLLKDFSTNYLKAGGRHSLSEYYHAVYDHARLDPTLREIITFAHHNLASDGVFCEAHLILCRNVLIYFDQTLKNRVLRLFDDSLVRQGFLCLGTRETLQFSQVVDAFAEVDHSARLYRKRLRPEAAP